MKNTDGQNETTAPAARIRKRFDEQFAQHENIYMRTASDLDRNRLWQLRDTMVRIVNEELTMAAILAGDCEELPDDPEE